MTILPAQNRESPVLLGWLQGALYPQATSAGVGFVNHNNFNKWIPNLEQGLDGWLCLWVSEKRKNVGWQSGLKKRHSFKFGLPCTLCCFKQSSQVIASSSNILYRNLQCFLVPYKVWNQLATVARLRDSQKTVSDLFNDSSVARMSSWPASRLSRSGQPWLMQMLMAMGWSPEKRCLTCSHVGALKCTTFNSNSI